MAARSTAARAAAIALFLACAACSRDFEGLFPSEGAGSSGSSGSSGDSGKPVVPGDCACSPCKGSPCKLTCPVGCKLCTCDPFTCEKGEKCDVACTDRTGCEVITLEGAGATVTCALDARCGCTGLGCNLTCAGGDQDPTLCGSSREVCNRECK